MKRVFALFSLVCVTVCAGCKSGTAGRVVSVSIAPSGVSVQVGTTAQFSATVQDTFNQGVTWSVVGGSGNGTINSAGLYTAPGTVPNPAEVTVMAVSQKDTTKSASATVTVTTTPPPANITVAINPGSASVTTYHTQQFTATVTGSTNTALTWQVNGVTGGSRTNGFISASGLYVAPGGVPVTAGGGNVSTTTVTVTAIAQANSNSTSSATVTIVPGNQSAQTGAIPLGTSGGNANDSIAEGKNLFCCGGTLGSLVTQNGTQYILSNNHVLARSDFAAVGEAIIQPGLIDVNCDKSSATTVANLTKFAKLESEVANASASNIDAAIAQVTAGNVDPNGNILYLGGTADANGVPMIGAPNAGSGVPAVVSMPVAKSGRTTGLTCSTVLAINTNTSVEYSQNCDGSGTTFTVDYDNQVDVMGGGFGAPGDSGSLIVDENTADPVALLYAGSDTDVVGNPVSAVLNFFSGTGGTMTFVGGSAHSVIGCTLPNAPQVGAKNLEAPAMKTDAVHIAVATRDAHGPELLAHPEVQAVGVGPSYDSPGEAAIVFFVTKGQSHADIPQQVDGIRTRIVEGDLFGRKGAISAADTALNEQTVVPPQAVYAISQAEHDRAKMVHTAHAREMIKQPGVQGVGISSSVDSPGEAALIIFVIRGVAHNPIPPVIDGLRTRVRESSRFKAGNGGAEPHRACLVPPSRLTNKLPAASLPVTH
jgi:hypothetical protein